MAGSISKNWNILNDDKEIIAGYLANSLLITVFSLFISEYYPVLALNFVSVDVVGELNYVMALVSLLSVFTLLGIDTYLLREYSSAREIKG